MVDVREVIPAGTQVDMTDSIALSPWWLYAHRKLGNLTLTHPQMALETSKKFSWRFLFEMLVDMEVENIPEWAGYEWLLIRLKEHHKIIRLDVKDQKEVTFNLGARQISIPVNVYGFTKTNSIGVFSGVTAVQERHYNQQMMALFGKKFPIKLKTLTPLRGEVKLSIPVEERNVTTTGKAAGIDSETEKKRAAQRDLWNTLNGLK